MVKLCLKRKMWLPGLFLLLLSGFNAGAQITNPAMGSSPWVYANPQPHGFTFSDMSFVDNNNGLAVSAGGLGSSGAIMRTSDGGRNWQAVTFKYATSTGSVSIGSFSDVHFVTPTVAYAVGGSGLMIKSTDGGTNWATISTPLTALAKNINALHFLNKDTGYIGGAAISTTNTTNINDAPKVYFTRNGGATWDSLVTPFVRTVGNATLNWNNQKEIQRIHFVNDSVGYVSGSSGNDFSGGQSALLWKIKNHVVTDYCLHRTKFGLTTGSHTPSAQTYKGILAVNDSTVLISSLNNSVVLRVKTGENDSTANALPAVFGNYVEGKYEIVIWLNSTATPFPASLVGNVAGQMQQIKKGPGGKVFITCGSSIINSTDNGTTWSFTKPHPTSVVYPHWGFNAMDVTANGRLVIGSFNGLTYDSLPGAPAWQTVYRNVRPLFYGLMDMDWADYCNGVAVGSNGTILKTSDGGRTWENNSNALFDAAQISLTNVEYHAVNSMFFTAGTTVYRSPDQGTSYDAIFTEPTANSMLTSFAMVGQDRAFVTAYRFSPAIQRTYIYRTSNANAAIPSWTFFNGFPEGNFAPQLRTIKFANQDTGYTCGNRGKVYRSIDGGATWTDISPDTTVNSNGTANYTALSVVNGKTLYVGGSSRKLFRSTDAGATWTDLTFAIPPAPTPVGSFTSITNIIMNDANNGYLNAGNIVMKTTNAWATWSYDLSPGSFSNIALYPKTNLPFENKKLYGMPLTAGTPVNSTQTAMLIEYGNAALYNISATETVVNASCTNPSGGSITINATGAVAPYTYSINGGPYQSSNVFSGLTQGPKTISIKDAGCQTITKTITIGFTDNLTVTASNDTEVCAGASVQLNATAPAGATYAWSPATGLSATTISNPVAATNVNTPVNTIITYTVTATLNSCVKTDNVMITIKPSPSVNAGPDKVIVIGDQATLNGGGIANPALISWTPANSIISAGNTYAPLVKPTATTTYTLSVTNAEGCTSADDATVTVLPYCVKVMNAFTPNGDGQNDLWIVTDNGGTCAKQVMVTVFNRYGSIMYKNDNYQNNWNGTYEGKPVADATYYYIVVYKLISGKSVTVKGDVTILR
jgi:gliding motility-associated-like protein